MELINFPGLNCYTNSIISLVNDLIGDYSIAFSSLWSETDFYYQPDRGVYLSKRLPEALELLGVKLIMQLCGSPEQTEGYLLELKEGELVIIGMDAFNVPWSQFYKTFHGPHFFMSCYTGGDVFLCYDPTFGKVELRLSRADIIAHAYDVSRIIPKVKGVHLADPLFDVSQVLRVLPGMRSRVCHEIGRIIDSGPENSVCLGKFMDALKNNRYLYRHYLERLPPPYNWKHQLLDMDHILKWEALKNGFFKASIVKKENLYLDIQNRFETLIQEEMAIAGQMLR